MSNCKASNEKEGERKKILQCDFQEEIVKNDYMSGNQQKGCDINIYNIVISKTVPKQHY